jgi:hypothetical protein
MFEVNQQISTKGEALSIHSKSSKILSGTVFHELWNKFKIYAYIYIYILKVLIKEWPSESGLQLKSSHYGWNCMSYRKTSLEKMTFTWSINMQKSAQLLG